MAYDSREIVQTRYVKVEMIPGFGTNIHRKRSRCYINTLRKFALDKELNVVY